MERSRCSECGVSHLTCPDCGGTHVTPLEPEAELSPTTSVSEWLLSLDDDAEATFTDVCWTCGWEQTKTVRVAVE